MNKRRWKEDLTGYYGMSYIHFKNVPMRDSKFGPIIELDIRFLEELAARAIIEHRVPLRGLEVRFLRKTQGLSMERFAAKLGLTSGAVFKWERDPNQRLHPVNEAVVRAFFAEVLSVDLRGRLSELIGTDKTPEKIILKAS